MLVSPLLLDYSNKLSTREITKINSQLEVNQLTQPKMSPVEYQIQITFPNNINLPKQGQLSFTIPTYQSLQSKVRLELPPSLGYGINSCYKVEYFEWQRPYIPGRLPQLSRIQKKLVYQEYWRIPTPDKFYLLSNKSYQDYKLPTKYETIKLIRSEDTYDSLINHLDVISIVSIKTTNKEYFNWKVIDNSLYWTPYFTPLTNPNLTPSTEPTIGIAWLGEEQPTPKKTYNLLLEGGTSGNSSLPSLLLENSQIGEEYEVNYIKPLTLEDIIYVDYTDKSILSNSGLFAHSSLIR